jgi:hypothetical protein
MTQSLSRWHVLATVAILALSTISALLGLFRPGHYSDPAALAQLYQTQDLTILVVGVPVLTIGLWFAARGSLRGRLVWLGGLTYMTYIWASVGLQVWFNSFFLVYAALFGLSLFTLVSATATTDAGAVTAAVEGRVAETWYGGLLVVIGIGLAMLWLPEIVGALLAGTVPGVVAEAGQQAKISHFVDLAVVVPALVLSGVWLARHRPWGYVLAGVMLVFGATLGASITAMTVVIVGGDAISISPVEILLSVAPVALAAGLALRYLTAMDGERRPPVGDQTGRAV